MKVTDYIISFLIDKHVTDIFGYPGGVICHLIDSATKCQNSIAVHTTYHEQGAAFAACGYAMSSSNIGVAFATSGPGATNLVTGVANAYFDSIPVLFFTGQVDTYTMKKDIPIRQRGFQETDIVKIMEPITKYSVCIDDLKAIRYELEKAYYLATSGNPGPVVIDLPADIQRANIDIDDLEGFSPSSVEEDRSLEASFDTIKEALEASERPCLLIGNGIKISGQEENIKILVETLRIPAVFSMPAFDILAYDHEFNYGFIGANGHRYGNFILGKSDLIITMGSRLDLKQVGNIRENFAPQAQIIRIDIDAGNLLYKVHQDEVDLKIDVKKLIPYLLQHIDMLPKCNTTWNNVCKVLKNELQGFDEKEYNHLITKIGDKIPDNYSITSDVGQSGVWIAQNLHLKKSQRVYMSAGHGAMGFSLPAAIGVYYGRKKPVVCFNGDGGLQMNVQELQFIKREKLPIKVIVINNEALGMIRGFQEANFDRNYSQTIEGKGYKAPDFKKIALAFDLTYTKIDNISELNGILLEDNSRMLIEVHVPVETELNPNFGRNGVIQDQRPYIERDKFNELMRL